MLTSEAPLLMPLPSHMTAGKLLLLLLLYCHSRCIIAGNVKLYFEALDGSAISSGITHVLMLCTDAVY
jgi:hypothetical protein